MRIRKKEQTAGLIGTVTNSKSESTTDTYSCDYINQMQDNIEEAIDKKIENGAYCQTVVTTATNGIINYDISSLGLSDKPAIVLLTPQSQLCPMQYDFDNSTVTNLHIILGGDCANFTGAIRFCYLIVPL